MNDVITNEGNNEFERPISANAPFLLCLDFDLTLTKTHMFHYVVEAINAGFSRENALLRAIQVMRRQGVRGEDVLWTSLARWLNAGHGVVVTSYTSFPELPQALLSSGVNVLRKTIQDRQLTRWLSRPLVVFGDPAPALNPPRRLNNTILIPRTELLNDDHGKNLHIQAAVDELKCRGLTYQRVILMDDDTHNIERALAAGYAAIQVERDDDEHVHLQHLNAFLDS